MFAVVEQEGTNPRTEADELSRRADYLIYEIDRIRDDRLLSDDDKNANAAALQEELHLVRQQLEKVEAD